MILSWIRSFMDWVQLTATIVFARLRNTVIRIAIVISILVLLVWISAFLYGSFYYLYMPSLSHVRPVHFQRECDKISDGICSYPRANVSLLSRYDDQLLKVGQAYQIFVELELPESQVNQDLGVFMVHMKLFHKDSIPVRESSRSAMLHYKSSLLQSLETYVFSPLLVFGVREQKQKIQVELFAKYFEDAYKPADRAFIELQNKNIQFYDTKLHMHAHFVGLRYIMFQFPLLSALGGISSNLLFLSMIVVFSWYQFFGPLETERSVIVKVGSRSKLSLEDRRRNLRQKMERERSLSTASLASQASQTVLEEEKDPLDPETISSGPSNQTDNVDEDDDGGIVFIKPKDDEKKLSEAVLQSSTEDMELRKRTESS